MADNNKIGAVMVVGGGIAGIQASLDLAESGFYVYLVEKKPAIGGVMAQLDKTFPTNDCSMCIISPKLVECGRHLNIELLTLSDIEEVNGEPGHFKVKIKEHPRFVDLKKCTACGECAKVCPIDLPNLFDEGLRDRTAIYKLYPQAMPSAYSIDKRGTSPCKANCPAHISIQGFVALIAKGRHKDALKLIKEEMPFPAVCGRVCHHPCEWECSRGKVDEPIAIEYLKRFVADLDLNEDDRYIPPVPEEKREEKVAIIGAGPAGLTAAYYLVQKGYKVTVFEKLPVAGGMMAVGIPEYRLPKDTLQAEIQVIKDMGVEIKTGVSFGEDITIDSLKKDGYSSIFLAIGLHESRKLGVEGEDLPEVLQGIKFLRQVALKENVKVGQKTLVIGGGNVAIDVALTALREGAEEVRMVCLEQRDEMPAWDYEIEDALEEGVIIENGWGPKRFLSKDGKLVGVEFKKCVSVFDKEGRFNPSYDENELTSFEADTVIVAIGQRADLEKFAEQGIELSPYGGIAADPVTLETNIPGVFTGGDILYGPKSVVEAVACGKEAAESIHRFINGIDLKKGREKEWKGVEIDVEGEEKRPRVPMPRLLPAERKGNYKEIALGFSEEEAIKEAERCLKCGLCSECYQCVSACLAEAIDHEMTEKERIIEVGSIILAPGFNPFDPTPYDSYGYGRLPNVVTSMEFERILSASGPFEGHLVRPSDGKEPEKIAWLQCVGSRDINKGDHSYCSAVCCMYAIKEAVIAKEHSNDPLDTAIFYMDMRTYGKEFERYYERAKENGVRFIRCRVHSIDPAPGDRLKIKYVSENGEISEEEFDMVVLSVGLSPPDEISDFAKRLGIELNKHDYALTSSFSPISTSREGIYVCGVFQAPKDIPQSVMEASAASCAATEALSDVRGTLIREKELPPEKDVSGEEIRIGVFVCNCGINIGGIADVPAVREYARTLPHVVHVEDNLFTCSQDTQDKMKEVIKEKGINRVVVASCSPRTHEPLFQETIREAGLNNYLFEMANIRDQNTWVHMNDPEKATEKAKELVRMAVAKVALTEPLQKVTLNLHRSALVIGGGVAGLEAALSVAEHGFHVYLVEKGSSLGGSALKLNLSWQGEDIGKYVNDLINRVESHSNIDIFMESSVKDSTGIIGNYTTTIVKNDGSQKEIIEHGVVIIATGGKEYEPKEYLYGEDERVVTALELDEALKNNSRKIEDTNRAVFIQCVGSRIPEREYCSRVCCTHSLRSAITLKEKNPDMEIFILYRDLRSYGFREDLYKKARELGVIFIRYDLNNLPNVVKDGEALRVEVFDPILGRKVGIDTDLLVLATAILPNDNSDLSEIFKVPVNQDGFFVEAHAKLRPVDFASDGIFMAGLAHYPKSIDESIAQAKAAVGRALTILSRDCIEVGGVVAVVDPKKCAVCLTCVRTCPYGVPYIGEEGHAVIEAAACHGCGACVAECPGKAITLQHFTDEQILAKEKALFAE